MSIIKTDILLQKDLLRKATEIATDMDLSRNKLIALALQEYIERYENKRLESYKNKRLFDALNAHYAEDDQTEELAISHAYTRSLKFTEENEW